MGPMAERERPELGPRKSAVLRAVVEAVRAQRRARGQRDDRRSGRASGVSSATIRNEMAALEELGYLTHPHTSAGRIPTDAGYRHYVDSLPPGGKLRDAQRRLIAGYFAEAIVDLEEVLKGSVQLLSRLTQYAGLAVPPSAIEEPVMRLELIDLGPTVMILAVGQHGRVDKRVIDRPEGVEAASLAETERKLAALRGQTYTEAQAQLLQLAAESAAASTTTCCCTSPSCSGWPRRETGPRTSWWAARRTWRTRPSRCDARRSAGCSRRWNARPRCSPCCRTSAPTRASSSVTIGTEHPSTGEWEASIVTAPFKAGETTLGTIGVVGPTRMDYLSAMASVRAVAKRLSEMATELDGERMTASATCTRSSASSARRQRRGHQEGVSDARARTSPGRERHRRRRGAVQGDRGRLRDPVRPGEAPAVRHVRQPGGPQGAPFNDIQDIFDMFFGQGGFSDLGATAGATSRTRHGEDLACASALSFTEAVFGVRKDLELERMVECGRCLGNGAQPGTAPVACRTCAAERRRCSRCAAASSAP